jgi:hypothetical protein
MSRLNSKDLVGGFLFFVLGLFFLLGALQLDIGTARRMGPGYMPVGVSVIAMLIGALIMLRGVSLAAPMPPVSSRPLLAVLASVLVFGLGVRWLGLVPAVILTVLVAALGDRESRVGSAIVLALFLALATWAIFRLGLGLPIPAFRRLPAWIL